MEYSVAGARKLITNEKTRSKKPRDTVPLRMVKIIEFIITNASEHKNKLRRRAKFS